MVVDSAGEEAAEDSRLADRCWNLAGEDGQRAGQGMALTLIVQAMFRHPNSD